MVIRSESLPTEVPIYPPPNGFKVKMRMTSAQVLGELVVLPLLYDARQTSSSTPCFP